MFLHSAPISLPPLSALLDDLGRPTPAALAHALDVSERTIRRWIAADQAPRVALLSLYWLTRWGRSQIDADATNDARVSYGLLDCLKRENAELSRRIVHMMAVGEFGAANQPLEHAPRVSASVVPIRPGVRRSTAA